MWRLLHQHCVMVQTFFMRLCQERSAPLLLLLLLLWLLLGWDLCCTL
jgi:hypothetical protein